jgi:vacuolar protein sorting-associated protein 26
MNSFFKPVCDIEIRLEGEDARDMVEFKTGTKDRKEKAPLYKDGESVKGTVIGRPKGWQEIRTHWHQSQFNRQHWYLLPLPQFHRSY